MHELRLSATLFFDINRVPGNGSLIFPLSMTRLHQGQDPKTLYDFIKFFEAKITEKTIDVVFLYTNGLYFNSAEKSSQLRKKTNAQMLTHKQEFLKILKRKREFAESAFHFLPWDYVLLQADRFLDLYGQLQQLKMTDMAFKKSIESEISGRIFSSENYDFIIEETLVTYLIRQHLIQLPTTLSRIDGWRLLIYAGNCLLPDVYLHNKGLLPKNRLLANANYFTQLCASSMYNMEKKQLINYNKIDFELWNNPLKITPSTSV